jgi:alpha-L-arabinofuranosidase
MDNHFAFPFLVLAVLVLVTTSCISSVPPPATPKLSTAITVVPQTPSPAYSPPSVCSPKLSENLLLNSGFENDFDGWYDLGDPPGATAQIDATVAHTGTKSLRITFDGSADVAYWHIGQEVPVEPNTTYSLQGYLRVEDIRAFSSIRLAVQDGRESGWEKLYESTTDLYATQDWTPVSLTFTTLADTGAVIVLATRSGMEGRFPISGTAWVDDVALVRLPPLVTPGTLTMHVGDTQGVSVGNGAAPYVWTSSDPRLVVVRSSENTLQAQVKAQAAGSVKINAVDAEGRAACLALTVIDQNVITIQADHILREVPEAMFGNNVQYYFTSQHIPDWPTWDRVIADPIFLADVAELGMTSLRFPGGMESNYYDFSLEKGYVSWMGGSEQYNVAGGITTKQFIQFLRDTGIPNAMITANVYKSGNKLWPGDNWISPNVAADWVEYTNHTLGFYVKYWELGNEVTASDEFPWAGDVQEQGLQVPGLRRDMYIQKIQEWSQVMKAVDPTIKIGAVALETPRGGGIAEWWTLPILQDRANDIDFLIIHPYVNVGPYLEGGGITDHTVTDIYAWIWATNPVARLRHWIDSFAPDRASAIGIQASEWSIYTAETVPKGNDSLLNVVESTDLLWDMVQEGMDGANLFLLCDGNDATLEPVSGGRKYAQYYMLWMNRRRSGKWLVESLVISPTYSAGPFGNRTTMDYMEAVDGVPYLSAYATLSEDQSRLYLIVTNKSGESQSTVIDLNNFTPQSQASVWQMTSANWGDANIQPVISMIANAAPTFPYTFPARSVTSFVFDAHPR